MCRLHVLEGIVPPSAAHSFGILMIRNNVIVVGESLVADGAFPVLLDNLALQQFPHLGG
jgi:hypothetical protein